MNKRHLFLFFIISMEVIGRYTSYATAQSKQNTLSISQEETTIPALEIHSAYQPTTLLSGKIPLKPPLLKTNNIDTLPIHYKIRSSSLVIPYESISINPLAYEVVEKPMLYKNYFSLLSGNTFLKLPKMRLSIGLGNEKNTHFRIYASHTAQRGNLKRNPFQQYRTLLMKAFGSIATQHAQIKMGLETEQLNYFKYGIQNVLPLQGAFTNKNLQNYLQDYRAYFNWDVSFNKVSFSLNTNLHYTLLNTHTREVNPSLFLSLENNSHKETFLYWCIKTGYTGNFLKRHPSVTPPTRHSDTVNHIAYGEGSIHYRYKTVGLDLALNVSYNLNGKRFYYLPFIHFYHKINQDVAILHLGWEERLQLNNLRSLYKYNHWLNTNTDVLYSTTYLQKWYLGLSGSWKNVWDYHLQVFFKMSHQLPLMVNAFNELQSFQVLFTPLVKSVGVSIGASYKFRDKIHISGYLLNENYPFKGTQKFGLSPLVGNLQASFFKVFKVLTLQTGLFWRTGGTYLLNTDGSTTKDGQIFTNSIGKIPNYLDLNFSLRARVASFLELYTTLSNILNRPNPLWLYYNEIPFSIGGGIILHFNTRPKKKKLQNNQP